MPGFTCTTCTTCTSGGQFGGFGLEALRLRHPCQSEMQLICVVPPSLIFEFCRKALLVNQISMIRKPRLQTTSIMCPSLGPFTYLHLHLSSTLNSQMLLSIMHGHSAKLGFLPHIDPFAVRISLLGLKFSPSKPHLPFTTGLSYGWEFQPFNYKPTCLQICKNSMEKYTA